MLKLNSKKDILLSGNEACAMGALAAGMRFFGGYPITPSTEIAEFLAKELPKIGGTFIQMEDEIASLAAVIGANIAGVKAMTATSGPGFSLMQEEIGYACMAEIPCVIVNVMRGGPSTGMPTKAMQGDVMQSRWGTHGDHPVIALCPKSVLECYTLTIHAFNLAEKYRTPVILLMDGIVGHMWENVELPKIEEIEIIERPLPEAIPENYSPYGNVDDGKVTPLVPVGRGYKFHITGLDHDSYGLPTQDSDEIVRQANHRKNKIEKNLSDIITAEEYMLDDAEICIVAYGSVARSAEEAVDLLREQGIKAGVFRPITIWPFPESRIKEISGQVKMFVVAEMNEGQIIGEVLKSASSKEVVGVNRVDGELLMPSEIVEKIEEGELCL